MKFQYLAPLAALALATSCGQSGQAPDSRWFPFETPESKAFVDSLYNRMSVEERAAQLYSLQPLEIMTDGEVDPEKCRQMMPYGIGHVCQFASNLNMEPAQIRRIAEDIQKFLINETPSGIPAILHEECISGFTAKGATIYPQQIGLACSWNTELARKKTELTAGSMRSLGVTMALSPMTDIIRNASWSRGEESYGEDAYLSAEMASAFVEGLQQGGPAKGVSACTKHFLGYGGGNTLGWKEICEEVLFPHEVCIRKSGSKAVMTSYGQFRSEQAVTSDTLLNVILRKGLGFDGVFVSDYQSIEYLGKDEASLRKTAALALNTGNDLEFPSNTCYRYLPELLESGEADPEAFERSVKRALTLKYNAGLFDPERKFTSEEDLDPMESRTLSYELAAQSVVMLKNDGVLPISGDSGRIALVGPNAAAFCAMLGDYTYPSMMFFWRGQKMDPETPHIVSLREGIESKLNGAELVYARGCEWSVPGELSLNFGGDPRIKQLTLGLIPENEETDHDSAIEAAAGSDVIIAAMGENPALCGEGRDRNGIRLPGKQQDFVADLIATGKPVVLVIFGGRPQAIDDIAGDCAAVLQAWYPGEEGGNAVADVLLGNVCPSGKLSITYPKHAYEGQYSYTCAASKDNVAWPFGFGLSYTSFEYADLKATKDAAADNGTIELSCSVRNTGKVSGDEIVQLYVSPAGGQDIKPVQLKGFARVGLAPGEKKTVTFRLSSQQLASCHNVEDGIDENTCWLVEPGSYTFRIGASSEDFRLCANVELTGDAVTIPFGGRQHLLTETSVGR